MAIKGSLSEASLPDVLQLLSMGRKTGCLSLTQLNNFGYIYFDAGRISRKMINVHAEELWNFNRMADTNNPATLDKDIYLGTAAYLLALIQLPEIISTRV